MYLLNDTLAIVAILEFGQDPLRRFSGNLASHVRASYRHIKNVDFFFNSPCFPEHENTKNPKFFTKTMLYLHMVDKAKILTLCRIDVGLILGEGREKKDKGRIHLLQ